MEMCIIIPSHIDNVSRTKLLMSCLQSLINQTHQIQIYLSISFETELDRELFKKILEKNNFNNKLICIHYQERKTSQFRHIEKVVDIIKDKYKYIMFCDDDDTYEIERVEIFKNNIEYYDEIACEYNSICPNNKRIFGGAYEMKSQKGSHNKSFYEYWSYCVNTELIVNFINIIKINNYDCYIDHKMCDVLFATYLRRLNNHVFIPINESLYNYNTQHEYSNSITQQILKKNKEKKALPQYYYTNFEELIENINKELKEQLEGMKSNIFLKHSMYLMSFENILKVCLDNAYKYKNKIDNKLLEELQFEYKNVESLCNKLYQNTVVLIH